MAGCCSPRQKSRAGLIFQAVLAWIPAMVFGDSALHYNGHGTSATLTRWIAAGVWLLIGCVYTWRAVRPPAPVCTPASGHPPGQDGKQA